MSISESLPLAATSPQFLSEALRIIKFATGKELAEAMFSLVDKDDFHSINILRLINTDYFLIKEDKTDNNLLHYAVQRQRSDICDILLKIKTVDINARNKQGYTPLHYAIKNNDISTLNKILDMPNINLNDNWKIGDDDNDIIYFPILHYAVKCGNFDIVKILLNHKRINVNVCDRNGDLALRRAFHKEYNHVIADIIDLFLNKESIEITHQNNDRETLLHLAIFEGYNYLVEDLVNKGINVNLTDRRNNTALHLAVERNYKSATERLLNIPTIKLDIKNIHGMTPCEMAARKGFVQIAELIRKKQSIKPSNLFNLFGLV
ncbi:ankyrin repeat domain-containing protein [Acerihabitans sp. KWT182]|uniref:Ankyrin repeat domain-containing protein n=1 Tax=Acerihabitans sp. KWT182 TaxID=3157919 RepID=A0AAU7QFD0_9GAMM